MAKTNNIQHIIKSSIINHTKNIIKDCFEDKKNLSIESSNVFALLSLSKLIINI